MDTFGIYGHALQGEDAVTAGKLGALFESLAAPAQEQGEGEAYKKTRQAHRPAGRKHKKVAQKGRRKPKVCRTRGRAFQENRLQFEKLHFFFAKPRFSASKYGKCVKKCVTGKKKNRLNPVFKRLFVCFHLKNDFFAQARGKKLRFHAVFRRVLICVFSHFPKKMWKTMWAVSGRGAGRFKAAAPSHTLPPHCAPHHFPWNPPGAAG